MQKIDHQDRAHAKLSASGSAKWMGCPGSVAAEQGYPNHSTIYTEEGTLAHELADTCLKSGEDADKYVGKKINDTKIEVDMARYVQEYIDYVRSFETDNSEFYTEERVDFSNVVLGGFGTMDAAIVDIDDKTCHIFDLKYGMRFVSAFENTQATLYAIGFLNELGFLHDIDNFCVHIVQPRVPNFSDWTISREQLQRLSEDMKQKAELALTTDAPRVPGDKQCEWCKAKADCPALAKFTEQIISAEFEDLDTADLTVDKLDDTQKKTILDNKKLVESFLKAVEGSVFQQLEEGISFPGYKLVEGRSIRQWVDGAEEALVEELGEDAYTKKLIGITEATKKVGKDRVEELAHKPAGKPTLAIESDKRKAIHPEKIENNFEELSND